MKGLNRVVLIGYIGHDPDVRHSQSGSQVVKISVATPNVKKVGEEWVDSPDWHRVTAFSLEADYLARFAKKGSSVALECFLKQNRWTDKEGRFHNDVEIVIDRVLWLGTRPGSVAVSGDTGGDSAPIPDTAGPTAEARAEARADEAVPF